MRMQNICVQIIGKMVSKELKAYGKAGAVAEEVISSIRTVLCYNGQERETHRFVKISTRK